MIRRSNTLVALLIGGAVTALAACGAPGGGAPGSAPDAAADRASTRSPSKLNLDEIFPPGDGRELVLDNCQNCHTFVPIVVLQMEKDAWQRSSVDHRDRVNNLSDEELKTVYEYLIANFGPHRPVPTLPKEFLESWTTY